MDGGRPGGRSSWSICNQFDFDEFRRSPMHSCDGYEYCYHTRIWLQSHSHRDCYRISKHDHVKVGLILLIHQTLCTQLTNSKLHNHCDHDRLVSFDILIALVEENLHNASPKCGLRVFSVLCLRTHGTSSWAKRILPALTENCLIRQRNAALSVFKTLFLGGFPKTNADHM